MAYDWDTKPDLSGNVVQIDRRLHRVRPPHPHPEDGGAVTGKIAIVKWTQDTLECGSVPRSGNLAAAGAKGFIFHNSAETFSAGITGSAVIPGVLITKSGGDAIRTALTGGQTVAVTGTSYGTVKQDFPANNDMVNVSSSRGGHLAGALKPDCPRSAPACTPPVSAPAPAVRTSAERPWRRRWSPASRPW